MAINRLNCILYLFLNAQANEDYTQENTMSEDVSGTKQNQLLAQHQEHVGRKTLCNDYKTNKPSQ